MSCPACCDDCRCDRVLAAKSALDDAHTNVSLPTHPVRLSQVDEATDQVDECEESVQRRRTTDVTTAVARVGIELAVACKRWVEVG